jgi:hypothetical protein
MNSSNSSKSAFYSVCIYLVENFKYILTFLYGSVFLLRKYSSDLRYRKSNAGVINVLGNGPSCHDTFNHDTCSNEKIMVVNYIALTDYFFKYKPEFYVLIDPDHIKDDSDKLHMLYEALSKVDWNMVLFVPVSCRRQAESLVNNNNITLKFINYNYLPGDSKALFYLYQKNIATPRFQNVVIACLYASINLGFKEIKLHGVESSEFQMFEINEQNEVLLNTEHSYGKATRNLSKEGKILKGEFWKYLTLYTYMLEGYSQVKSYSDFVGCKIVNYTKKSFIDSFDKR